jgi:hypothetical protein
VNSPNLNPRLFTCSANWRDLFCIELLPILAREGLGVESATDAAAARQFWKDSETASFQGCLKMSGWLAAIQNAPAIEPPPTGGSTMIRKSLLAIAATFMTLGAFSGTVALMAGSAPVAAQVA